MASRKDKMAVAPAPTVLSKSISTRLTRAAALLLSAALFLMVMGVANAVPDGSTTLTGRLVEVHGDWAPGGGKSSVQYKLRTTEGDFDLSGHVPATALGYKVEMTGIRSGKSLAVAQGGTNVVSAAPAVAANTNKNVAVILFNFTDNTGQPYTPSYANGVVFSDQGSVANYYLEQSYGRVNSFVGKVYGWYTIPYSSAGCNYSTWATAANNAAAADGFKTGDYTNIHYAFPYIGSCGWAGLAYLPGTTSWDNGSMNLRVVGHELGHNFGVHHASSYACRDAGNLATQFSGNCSASEYGDPFDIMGSNSQRWMSNYHVAQFGWMVAGDVVTVNSSGTYDLAPFEQVSLQPKMLRILRPGTSQYFNLEFRQPIATSSFENIDPASAMVNGITVRMAPDVGTVTQTMLLDMNPSTSTFNDAPLAVGQSFVDGVDNLTITTKSVSATKATVEITLGSTSDTTAPTAPSGLTATALTSTSIRLNWGSSTDNVGVTGYRVYRDSTLRTTVSSSTLTYTDSGLNASQSYSYSVSAIDQAGNESVKTAASATTLSPDVTAPSAPGTLTGMINVKSGQVSLQWGASTDNVGVTGYQVFRGGVRIATVTTLTYSQKVAKGSYTYYVTAVDAAGNVSAASNSVTLIK